MVVWCGLHCVCAIRKEIDVNIGRAHYIASGASGLCGVQDGEVMHGVDGTYWRAMWVLHKEGKVQAPSVLQEIEQFELALPVQASSAASVGTKSAQTYAKEDERRAAVVKCDKGCKGCQKCRHTTKANIAAMFKCDPGVLTVAPVLGEILDAVRGMKLSPTAWKDSLAKLRVKEAFRVVDVPKAKGSGVRRATWPKDLPAGTVEVPSAFAEYLRREKLQKECTAGSDGSVSCTC